MMESHALRTLTPMRTAFFCLLTPLLWAAGCQSGPNVPPAPTPQPYATADAFVATLSPQGSQFKTFNVLQTATTTITLASEISDGATVSAPLTLLLGSLSADGNDCAGSTTVTVAPALTAHIKQSLAVATYCVKVSDPGSLSGNVDFGVIISQAADTTVLGSPAGTDTFSSNLYPMGAVVRTFSMTQTGQATVTLSSVSPAASVGIGVGMTSDGNNCLLNQLVVTTPGSGTTISATADAGLYCVKVYDPGSLANRVVFTAQITHQ